MKETFYVCDDCNYKTNSENNLTHVGEFYICPECVKDRLKESIKNFPPKHVCPTCKNEGRIKVGSRCDYHGCWVDWNDIYDKCPRCKRK